MSQVALSVLDTAPVGRQDSASVALRNTVELARAADRLGFTRFWVTEHHNAPGIASSSPAVLLSRIGAVTERIRIGSGGVMLPNHPPLVTAENFGTLGTLYPGRVDLGVGRAPGTDEVTALALRRVAVERFEEELVQLRHFLANSFPSEHPYHDIRAVPVAEQPVRVWMLGSSGRSAVLAGQAGLPYVFAHNFFNVPGVAAAVRAYRDSFRASAATPRPYAAVAVHVVCGENDEHARWLADPAVFAPLALGQVGRLDPFVSPEEAAAYAWTAEERARADQLFEGQAIGGPGTVRDLLLGLLYETGADELIVTNNVTDGGEKLRSIERVREALNDRVLAGTGAPAGKGS